MFSVDFDRKTNIEQTAQICFISKLSINMTIYSNIFFFFRYRLSK